MIEGFWPYVIVMALVTYLVRVAPLTLMNQEITNKFVLSFLYYVPYACLAAMVFPAILTSTESVISGMAGLLAAAALAYMERSLITVAIASCGAVFITERLLEFMA